jgi:hypothetical protein
MPWLDSIAHAIAHSVQWFCSFISAVALAAPATVAIDGAHPDSETNQRQAVAVSAAFVMAGDVTGALKQLSPTFTDDEPLRVIAAGPNRIGAFVVGRPKRTGPAQSHPDGSIQVTEGLQLDQVSAIVRILDGAGTIVTGGKLIDPKRMPAADPDAEVIGPGQRGKSILGGESRRMSAGDMVIIPAGAPHGFSEIETPITYLVIRVDTGHVLPLR